MEVTDGKRIQFRKKPVFTAAVAVYTFVCKNKGEDRHFRGVIWAYIALTAVQCFVFPYETENEIMRIIEAVEGAAVSAS